MHLFNKPLDIVVKNNRIEMSRETLETMINIITVQPELNEVHNLYKKRINAILSRVVKKMYECDDDERYSLKNMLNICVQEHFVTKGRDYKGKNNPRPMTKEDILCKSRNRGMVDARQRFCYYAKKYSQESLSKIGFFLNGRDHSTVIHSIESVKKMMDVDVSYRLETERIEVLIRGVEHIYKI